MSFANCVLNSEYEDSWEKKFDTAYMPNAFPSLAEMSLMPVTKPQQPLSVATARFGKGKKVVMEVPIKSYAEEKREETRNQDDIEHKKRMHAYEILSDKEKLGIHLTKTRMCNSVNSNIPCFHGESCRFAHNLSELVPGSCLFNICRFVRMKDGKLVNNGNKMCHHLHPEETYDEFIMRTGLDRYKIAPKIEPKIAPKTVVESLEPKVVELNKKVFSWLEKSTLVAPDKPTIYSEKEILLRVPKELAVQAMELAMKSGNTCIRVEIIG